MTSTEEIENLIKPLLLTNISFNLEGKKLKAGKLILFSIRDFFCVFTLIDAAKNRKVVYEVPYPFELTASGNSLIFNYTVDAFCEKSLDIQSIVKEICPKKTTKLFNKKLVILSNI